MRLIVRSKIDAEYTGNVRNTMLRSQLDKQQKQQHQEATDGHIEGPKSHRVAVHGSLLNVFTPADKTMLIKEGSRLGSTTLTDFKNNSARCSRWAAEAMLAGVEMIQIGYLIRQNLSSTLRHRVLYSE